LRDQYHRPEATCQTNAVNGLTVANAATRAEILRNTNQIAAVSGYATLKVDDAATLPGADRERIACDAMTKLIGGW